MGTKTGKPLTPGQAKRWLRQLEEAAAREACWSCECVQAFITQLELDATDTARLDLEPYEVRREKLHGCLGCRPCPPADLFNSYLNG